MLASQPHSHWEVHGPQDSMSFVFTLSTPASVHPPLPVSSFLRLSQSFTMRGSFVRPRNQCPFPYPPHLNPAAFNQWEIGADTVWVYQPPSPSSKLNQFLKFLSTHSTQWITCPLGCSPPLSHLSISPPVFRRSPPNFTLSKPCLRTCSGRIQM